MIRRWACVLLVVSASASASTVSAGEKYALLVGLDQSMVPGAADLSWAERDVEALTPILKKNGYRVVPLTSGSATRAQVVKALSSFARKLTEEDDFLLFFSGHGVRNTGINSKTYWLTFQASLDSLDESAIRLQHLMDYVREIKARRKLVLLDHCYAYEVLPELMPPTPPPAPVVVPAPGTPTPATETRGLDPAPLRLSDKGIRLSRETFTPEESSARGLVILTAARNKALESSTLQQGVFTHVLIRALTTREADRAPADGNLTLQELTSFLKERVPLTLQTVAPGFEQSVDDFVTGLAMGDWVLSTNLPIDNVTDVRKKRGKYEETLTRWQLSMPSFEWEIKMACLAVLDSWEASVRAGTELAREDQQVLEEIRHAIDTAAAPEAARANGLELVVREIKKLGPSS